MDKIAEIEKAIKFRDDEIKALRELVESLFDNIEILRRVNANLLEALEGLVECSPCQNGCDEDDMTCATMKAKRAIKKQLNNQTQKP